MIEVYFDVQQEDISQNAVSSSHHHFPLVVTSFTILFSFMSLSFSVSSLYAFLRAVLLCAGALPVAPRHFSARFRILLETTRMFGSLVLARHPHQPWRNPFLSLLQTFLFVVSLFLCRSSLPGLWQCASIFRCRCLTPLYVERQNHVVSSEEFALRSPFRVSGGTSFRFVIFDICATLDAQGVSLTRVVRLQNECSVVVKDRGATNVSHRGEQ